MATTITPSTLTVTLTTSITINNRTEVTENKLYIASINEIDTRIVTIPTSGEVTVMNFGASVAAGTFIGSNVKHLQIVNKDTANFVRIRVAKTGGQTFDIKLEAGKFFILGNNKESATETEAAFVSFEDIDSISAQADTANVDIEYSIACS